MQNKNLLKSKKTIIGALHFMPLIGYEGFIDYKTILEKAKEDLKAFEKGGVDAVILENNYNFPHRIKETEESILMMSRLSQELSKITKLPLGISLLFNDFKGAFKIAKGCGAKFIRVPVFVDSVLTDFGEIIAYPKQVMEEREAQNAQEILIFADIHVKHAEMLDKEKSISCSAIEARNYGADAIILTGVWTGDAPLLKDLREARSAVGETFPIIIGSGADKKNIKELLNYSDAVIVSTSLKEGKPKTTERNLKSFDNKINEKKVSDFVTITRTEENFYKDSLPSRNMAKEMKVTPYEVSGEVDYSKLVTEFGVSKLDEKTLQRIKKHTGELHLFLKRGVFFAHRDMNWLLDEYEKGNKFFLYTGRASSKGSKVHLGHLIPWIMCRWLQDKFNVEFWFQFPDEEKFLYKQDMTLDDTAKATHEDMLDVIALGFDPKKTHFLVDTKHAGLMYKEACKVAKKITFSTVKASFGFNDSANIGSIFYTAMQAVPAFLPSVLKGKNIPCLIPLGIDQDPHFRISRDVMPKLGYYKPAIIHNIFLPPLAGMGGKMSASAAEEHVIYTTDSPEEVKSKINKHAFSGGQPTLEEQKKKGGNPDIDVSFQYLRMFFEPDDKKLEKIRADYKSGKLMTGELKAILIEKINAFLKEHQKKREAAKSQIDKFLYK